MEIKLSNTDKQIHSKLRLIHKFSVDNKNYCKCPFAIDNKCLVNRKGNICEKHNKLF
ncbi:hypothetical protein [uncultured Clostridium sp.]|uniref:hypothetical protein n=1 Tax=uncultured Clostridium sp. TaxID=59620 RepID=UPI003217B334